MAIKEHYLLLEADMEKRLKNFSLDIQFSLEKGCLGILGPSGCGKSMTLKSIAGIITPDKGRIALQYAKGEAATGRVFYDSSLKINEKPQKRRVGYLFQNYALFPNMTVEENIMTGLRALAGQKEGRCTRSFFSAADRKKRVGEMIERFRLKGLEQSYPSQLSGGQQQRVALARILAYEPEVLLLDEPFSAMDTYLREGLRLELSQVLSDYDGLSILVTHDRDEAYQLCSSLLLMDQGHVLGMGKTGDIFQNPETVQAARLTGCKNISNIERIGDRKIRALDWGGLELTTEQPVSASVQAVGIRAHDFIPLSEAEAASWQGSPEANLIPTGNVRISEMPFEWYVTLENGLWWKREKNIRSHIAAGVVPTWLRIEPSALLLLSEDSREAG